MNYPDIQKLFDEQNLLCFGGPNSECSGCKFGNCYGCSDLRLLEAYEAAIKLEIEAEVNKQTLDNIEIAQCNVELGKENERLRESLKMVYDKVNEAVEDIHLNPDKDVLALTLGSLRGCQSMIKYKAAEALERE